MDSGIYFRAERNGKWESVDLVDLSPEEVQELYTKFSSQVAINTIVILANIIREAENLL